MNIEIKKQKRQRRRKRVRAKISGTAERPRLCVFRSAKHIYAQLIIDGQAAKVIAAASNLELKKGKGSKVEKAKATGKLIAEKAKNLKIEKIVFDKKEYKYHGRVKAVAEGAREGGLKF
jgi:large subunit ribosomal protein L18